MKYLFLSILVVLIAWPILGLFTQDMDFGGMGLMIVGIVCGFVIGRESKKRQHEDGGGAL